MLYPPVADLLKNIESRYLLVNVVASRARTISDEAEALQEELDDKPVTMAIREVAEGKLTATLKDEYKKSAVYSVLTPEKRERRGAFDREGCCFRGEFCHR